MGKGGPDAIEHIVVVMMENRSFDHLFAYLDGAPPWAGEFENPAGPLAPGKMVPLSSNGSYDMPLDPPHSHPAALESFAVDATRRFHMNGFVAAAARKAAGQEDAVIHHWVRQGVAMSFVTGIAAFIVARVAGGARRWVPGAWIASVALIAGVQWARRRAERHRLTRPLSENEKADAVARAQPVMACMAPDRIPVLATLAREFTVCTRWFCSVPGETWPNRTFVHCGTSEDTVEIEPGFTFADTIFDRLEEGRHTPQERDRAWRIYADGGIPHLAVFPRLWMSDERLDRWSPLASFGADVREGRLPAYSFIEPRHQAPGANSQHPGNNREAVSKHASDFEQGEYLIAHVYEALRKCPNVFKRTLLIITYDENGGFFDHEKPQRTTAPARVGRRHWSRWLVGLFVERHHYPFTFRLTGARVPTLVVSPLVPAVRNHTVFDHTTIPATIRAQFAAGTAPLSRREKRAKRLVNQLEFLDDARTDLPDLSQYAERRSTLGEPQVVAALEVGAEAEPDLFSRQLDALAKKLRDQLPPHDVPLALEDAALDPRVTADPNGDVIVRLLGSAPPL